MLLQLLLVFFLQFTDKAGSEQIALSELALDKRAERHIEIDSMDYAVSPIYLDSILSLGATIMHTSRWINGATIQTDSNTLKSIAACSFIKSVEMTRGNNTLGTISQNKLNRRESYQEANKALAATDNARQQKEQINLNMLHDAGFHGQGITMAIVDCGFYNVNTLAAFDSVRNQILGIYDLTDDTDSITGSADDHGSLCFSAIAGITGNYTGTATAANYYLMRSEEAFTESRKEVDNWVAAIELADSLGVDIVSSSLGYMEFDDERFHFEYADLDGRTSRAAQAAIIAARKGMLIVMAAGNAGDEPWHYIATPSDADSILTVGAVDSKGVVTNFSAWGPTADGRVKPEVCARGSRTALINPYNNQVKYSDGTSFACPIIAGMAACLWSALPEATNMEIRERIIESAHRYHFPHDHYGYGIPNAWEAYTKATAIPQYTLPKDTTKKMLIDGQLWIVRDGVMYSILGYRTSQKGL